MRFRNSIGATALAAVLIIMIGRAAAFDDAMYPNLKGQWTEFIVPGLPGQRSFDQTKPWRPGQEASLTRIPESPSG